MNSDEMEAKLLSYGDTDIARGPRRRFRFGGLIAIALGFTAVLGVIAVLNG